MLPDTVFKPLDLGDLIEHQPDLDAIIDLLAEALTDPRARGDESLEEYVQELVEGCRESGRQRDGIDALTRLAELEPGLAGELYAEIASLHIDLGERDVALDRLHEYHARQRQRPAEQRDLGFYASAAVIAGDEAGDDKFASTLLDEGTKLARERKDDTALMMLKLASEHLRPRPGTLSALIAELRRQEPSD